MEAMAIESLVAAHWELEGFLTKVRQPAGKFSDIDVIGVNAHGHVRIAECKATQGNTKVFGFGSTYQHFTPRNKWDRFLSNIPKLYSEGHLPGWLPKLHGETEQLEIWFVSNSWCIDQDTRELAERSFRRYIVENHPEAVKSNLSSFNARIRSTAEIIFETIKLVREAGTKSGRRFGHPVLDVFRELLRFSNPDFKRNDSTGTKTDIRKDTRDQLLRALGLDSACDASD